MNIFNLLLIILMLILRQQNSQLEQHLHHIYRLWTVDGLLYKSGCVLSLAIFYFIIVNF